ncbi:hypothetical protein EDE08_113174 [Bradyrhizobium sp. R2.2-H]|jgi:hypothetical protein|uniref:hypothetical protein n=1 Tax=unclassified Bradyrhizobium TaxID=2631580 RepID=UPI0010466D31|nr:MULTISPECIES: hypothetical protein [unclassified Bradyrhizobium]TCU65560.1 hypothetical protein EDE10_113174 [Bradyrhizobium sp. Y-H1]TCU67707.1 hypothetical protein EDE08_113174 [Bradyrhizobium sp. R2.2-H]
MPYAVFKDGEKLSRTFSTKQETLEKADEAGLVEHDGARPVLEDELKIEPCAPDPEAHDDADLDWTPAKPSP